MQLQMNLVLQDKKTDSTSWTLWQRDDARSRQWLEHNVNIFEESRNILREMSSRKKGSRKKASKKEFKIQFQATHNEASRDAIIAISSLEFTKDCMKHPRPKPSKKPASPKPKTKKHKPDNPQIIVGGNLGPNKQKNAEITHVISHAPSRAISANHHAAAYRPDDLFLDLSESYSRNINSNYEEPAGYIDYDKYLYTNTPKTKCTYTEYAVDIGDCIKGFKYEMNQFSGYPFRKGKYCR
jgi:hypothetical protein